MPRTAAARSALSPEHQQALREFKAGVFQVLAHPTRIHVIECLGDGPLTVGSLLERIGVEPANLSQHLGVLRAKQLVTTRKDGNQVWYALRDPMLIEVLNTMRRFFQSHLEEAMGMLRDLSHSR